MSAARPPIITPEGQPADSRLAWELVARAAPLPDILRRHGLTVTEMQAKLREPMFRSMMAEAQKLWGLESLSTKERIRLKAQLLTEDGLEALHEIIHNGDLNPQVRVDAFEKMAKVGSLATPDQKDAALGERTVININIPGVAAPVTISAVAPAIEGQTA